MANTTKTYSKKSKKSTLFTLIFIYLILCFLISRHNQIFAYFFPEKIWVHRVNSIEKLKEVYSKFEGVELDVVFMKDKNVFDVNHPPARSINLSLLEYLSSVQIDSAKRFWLDFKNLTDSTMVSSYQKLDTICNIININKDQLVVESKNPEFLNIFHKNGYKTSYYLPGNLYALQDTALEKEIQTVKDLSSANETTFLSANLDHYHLLKEHFPDRKMLTWAYNYSEGFTLNPIKVFKKIKPVYYKYKVLSDENVAAVLFIYQPGKGNR